MQSFVEQQCAEPVSYPHAERTRDGVTAAEVPGFDVDHNRVQIGEGREAFGRAVAALRDWRQFPAPWTRVLAADGRPRPAVRDGAEVAVLIRAVGLWWLNAARIVYVLDEDGPGRRAGYAYGTLPGHVERGEERFSVELLDDGSVWYDVLAFSRPRHWAVRLAYPLARRLQRRFVLASQTAMLAAIRETT